MWLLPFLPCVVASGSGGMVARYAPLGESGGVIYMRWGYPMVPLWYRWDIAGTGLRRACVPQHAGPAPGPAGRCDWLASCCAPIPTLPQRPCSYMLWGIGLPLCFMVMTMYFR